MRLTTAELREQMKEGAKLDNLIWANLKNLGFAETDAALRSQSATTKQETDRHA